MSLERPCTNRFADEPQDKPQVDRGEHGNLQRPGAQFHPRAVQQPEAWFKPAGAWRTH